jgi:tyrosinase
MAPQVNAANVVLKSAGAGAGGGAVVFLVARTAGANPTLALTLSADGSSVNFYVAGSVASTTDQDILIQVTDAASGALYGQRSLMVRIRKNANGLTAGERDRFLSAFAKFNLTQSNPNYQNFLDMHNTAANTQIHTTVQGNTRYSFLLWHRNFILDLERQLQKIDASVSLPYWKFDEPAPNLFTADFMGADGGTGSLYFNPTNPLITWAIAGKIGVIRQPLFNVQTSGGNIPGAGPLLTQSDTLSLGTSFMLFSALENNPHGYAHECFASSGPLTDITRAPQDPLFFLLHCNVDRLWALWQTVNSRYDLTNPDTYPHSGAYIPGVSQQTIGDYLEDTMWPWNGATGGTRPPTAPGGQFPELGVTSSPSAVPVLWQTIDYQGYTGQPPSYADYDVVNFDTQTVAV